MDEPVTEQNPSTGPKTPEGKAISSMNRLTHGCRSPKTVLRDEDPAEFEAGMQAWYDQYQPADDISGMLVEETGLAQWFFKRNRRRMEEIEFRLPGDAGLWTPEHHKDFQIATRYRTTAERAFFRWFNDLERHYGRIHRREHLQQVAFARLAALELKCLTGPERQVEQTIEVTVVEGGCETVHEPQNEEIIEAASERNKPPLSVSRTLLFLNGVPPEYNWALPHLAKKPGCQVLVQKIPWFRWLDLIKHEANTGGGDALPSWTVIPPSDP